MERRVGSGKCILFALSCLMVSSAFGSPVKLIEEKLLQLHTPGDVNRVERARLFFYLGRFLAEEGAEEDRLIEVHQEGRRLGRAAYEENRDDPGAILWWTANLGQVGAIKKNFWALGAIKDIEREMKRLHEIAPMYGYSAADRVLGSLYQQAPGFVSIGSMSDSKECLQRAMKTHPDFPGNQIAWLKWLIEEEEFSEARDLWAKIHRNPLLETGDLGDFYWERYLWKSELQKLSKVMEGAKG